MTLHNPRYDSRGMPLHPDRAAQRARATGFAAVLLMIIGVLHVVQGIMALTPGDAFTSPKGYFLGDHVTAKWAWAHIVLGVLAVAAGWALRTQRAGWARGAAVVVVAISLFASFLWIPYAPVAACIVIALDIFVMWAAFADLDRNAY